MDDSPLSFTKPWGVVVSDEGTETKVPLLDVSLCTAEGGMLRGTFVVDSGADVSMGPRRLCDRLGLVWEKGMRVELRGISPREECKVSAAVHAVELFVPEANCRITVPFCFAEAEDAPALLGREGFFDAFGVYLDKRRQLTRFELLKG